MSGFYEGGYSAYGGGGSQNTAGSGGYNYNAGGSSDAFSGSMGSSSYNYNAGNPSDAFSGSMGTSSSTTSAMSSSHQTQPIQRPNAPSSSSSSHQNQQYQYQQPSNMGNSMSGAMNFWNPAVTIAANAAVTGKFGDVNSQVMMNAAESMGKEFLQKGWAKAVPGLERSMLGLRPYFAVDNTYVRRKMTKVLFPFLFREWARQEKMEPNPDGYPTFALPQQDENAPDLYIPSMSLLTYVLLCALCYGNAGKFSPEVLPDVTTKCVVTQILEVIAIRVGFYLMEAPVAMLDLLSYTGYKYLGLCVNMLIGLTMGQLLGYGNRSYYFTYLWTATSVSYFILKVMANCIPRRTSAVGPKRQFMVLGFAASQFATCWFVSQTKFLD
ncbi:hypothetical protein ACHAW5_002756 [Stephanodiscus triporus]|uniref:Protein YIF1 n=1 Tax=Stephanodiscus triporus TaxID=2934178 RepID=A0ABD3NJP1_9STRA